MNFFPFFLNFVVIFTLPFVTYGNHEGHRHGVFRDMRDKIHGIKMGIPLTSCDDGETGTEIDWDGSPVNYTCFRPKNPIGIRDIPPLISCTENTLPPIHQCLDTPIVYNESIPSSGRHRPLWPVFGEYKFVPAQRWVHSLEHGALVMLYDPCAHPAMVEHLRKLVVHCIRKHVITPYHGLTRKRPLALVTWGCVMQINYVHDKQVVKFIRETAMKAPESDVVKEGQYKKMLLKQARPPFGSNMNDTILCPFIP